VAPVQAATANTMTRPERAAVTRSRVIQAARALFLAQGYAATTTRQVAAEAGVTERTLFNIVANKSDLLRQVLLTYVFTDDQGPLLQRRDFAATLRAKSPYEFLIEYTRWVQRLHAHTSDVAEMVRAAASVDGGAAELWVGGNAQQIADLLELAKTLRQREWLKSDVSTTEAALSFAVLSGHETFWRLVVEQGWSRASYRRWLHRHCAIELIPTLPPR
jgi:AcrR family transcriptional regulator